jgi:hypothetical protein
MQMLTPLMKLFFEEKDSAVAKLKSLQILQTQSKRPI